MALTVDALSFSAQNANNRQLTWGVLASALWGIRDFMTLSNVYSCAYISIFDGIHLVGTGRIEIRAPPTT